MEWKSPESRWWVLAPVALMVLIQVVSGVPHPTSYITEPLSEALGVSLSDLLNVSLESLSDLGEQVLDRLHVPVFGVLALLWCWAAGPWSAVRPVRLGVATGICVVFSIVNEVSQLAVPARYATVPDALANMVGVGLGLIVFMVADRVFSGPS